VAVRWSAGIDDARFRLRSIVRRFLCSLLFGFVRGIRHKVNQYGCCFANILWACFTLSVCRRRARVELAAVAARSHLVARYTHTFVVNASRGNLGNAAIYLVFCLFGFVALHAIRVFSLVVLFVELWRFFALGSFGLFTNAGPHRIGTCVLVSLLPRIGQLVFSRIFPMTSHNVCVCVCVSLSGITRYFCLSCRIGGELYADKSSTSYVVALGQYLRVGATARERIK
jgi:hypothetical protein